MTVTTIGAEVYRSGNMKTDKMTPRGWKMVATGEQWHEFGRVVEVNAAGRVRVAWYLMVTPHQKREKKVRTWNKASTLRLGSPADLYGTREVVTGYTLSYDDIVKAAAEQAADGFMVAPAGPAPRLF